MLRCTYRFPVNRRVLKTYSLSLVNSPGCCHSLSARRQDGDSAGAFPRFLPTQTLTRVFEQFKRPYNTTAHSYFLCGMARQWMELIRISGVWVVTHGACVDVATHDLEIRYLRMRWYPCATLIHDNGVLSTIFDGRTHLAVWICQYGYWYYWYMSSAPIFGWLVYGCLPYMVRCAALDCTTTTTGAVILTSKV